VNARDLRLDFFRGLGQLFIFLDHIPNNVLSYFTLGGIVFNDAAELFVFISGYSAALVFGGMLARHGWAYATVQVLKRCWTLYVAHVFLFVVFVAQVSYTATTLQNPMFLDEMQVAELLQTPHAAVLQALALRLQPVFMNILPLYMVLLLGFALILPLLRARPWLVLAAAFGLYVAATMFHLNLRTYPDGVWFFNPLTWQVVFLLGASFALRPDDIRWLMDRRAVIWISAGFLVACVVIHLVMLRAYRSGTALPLVDWLWTVADKTNLGPLRLLNFLALAHVTVVLLPRGHRLFLSVYAEPVALCGQHSLNIFCLGIFLSLLGFLVPVEVGGTAVVQCVVAATGILIMFAAAYFLSWSKRRPHPAEERMSITADRREPQPKGEA
jgi:hypothetical protein